MARRPGSIDGRGARRAGLRAACATAALLALSVQSPARADTPAASGTDVAIGDPLAITIYLPLRNEVQAEFAARAMQIPGATYHRYLSRAQFVARYAATDATIARVQAILRALGYTPTTVFPNHLAIQAVAPVGTIEQTLQTTLERRTLKGRTGIVATRAPTLPASLAGLVRGFGGLDSLTHAKPLAVASVTGRSTTRPVAGATLVGGTPGDYLPADFESFYDVLPLVHAGLSGRGTTIGIVTLNDFKPSDAYLFWQQIGLNVSPTRITKVDVDGGLTASTNNPDGEGETDLDVEESGAIAPDANERVYIAPNLTNANFVDGFEAAASENIADTVSSSWGQPELDFFYNVATGQIGDLFLLEAFHDVFLEMALQGQSLFIASGDSGSFDTVRGCTPYATPPATEMNPICNAPYSVDHPAADPLVTASGGTTLPNSFTITRPTFSVTYTATVEQAWSWKYLVDQQAAQGHPIIPVGDLFSVGSGGGVSSYWLAPWYQVFTPNVALTVPNQDFVADIGTGPQVQNILLSNFPGRNLPDLSANADPDSGYQYIQEGEVSDFYGGTSFVAPQLNGVNALFTQALGRSGQLNPAIYLFGQVGSRDIATGDNWGYQATTGYDRATGIGVLDASKLLAGLALAKAHSGL